MVRAQDWKDLCKNFKCYFTNINKNVGAIPIDINICCVEGRIYKSEKQMGNRERKKLYEAFI